MGRENMMDAMARPDSTRGQEKLSKEEMVADGRLMIAAGTDTTANALGNILWHVTQDKETEKRLLKELRARMGKEEDVGSASLDGDGFEYLKAVVKEGLSLSYGVPGRLIRGAPKEGAKFGETWVPGGVSGIVSALKVWITDFETGGGNVRHLLAEHRSCCLSGSLQVYS
jgi:cytochrome P450